MQAVASFGSLEKWVKIEKKETPLEKTIKTVDPTAKIVKAKNHILTDYIVIFKPNKVFNFRTDRWEQFYIEVSKRGREWTISKNGTHLGRFDSLEEMMEFLKAKLEEVEQKYKSRTIKLDGSYILTPNLVAITKRGATIITEEEVFFQGYDMPNCVFNVPPHQLAEVITIHKEGEKIKLPLIHFWPEIQQGLEILKEWGRKFHVSVAINKTGARALILGPDVKAEPILKLGYQFVISVNLKNMMARMEYFDHEALETRVIEAPLDKIKQFLNEHRKLTVGTKLSQDQFKELLAKTRERIEAVVEELKRKHHFLPVKKDGNTWILERGAGRLSIHLIGGGIPKIAVGFKWLSYSTEKDRYLLPLDSVYNLPPLNHNTLEFAEVVENEFHQFIRECREIEKAVDSIETL